MVIEPGKYKVFKALKFYPDRAALGVAKDYAEGKND